MSKNKIIACMGDSLTAGYGLSENQAWTYLLSIDSGFKCHNFGISGDTTIGMLTRFNDMISSCNPGYIIIMGGTNDLAMNLPENAIIANIMAMTRHAKHLGIIPIIGIPTSYYPVQPQDKTNLFITPEHLRLRINSYQQTLRQFAIQDERFYIDFSGNMGKSNFQADGIHPDASGQMIMAQTAIKYLAKIE